MAAVSGRKKSVNSSSGLLASSSMYSGGTTPALTLNIDTPVAMNTILNKQAATSLYQRCLAVRNDLYRIHDFPPYFARADLDDPEHSRDAVHRLWHCLALGIPLCFLYNLLDIPIGDRINITTDPDDRDFDEPDTALKLKKKAAAFFIMGIQKLKNSGQWTADVELFTVTELTNLEAKDTNGFVKVVATIEHLLSKLPEHVWIPESEAPPQSAGESGPLDQFGEDTTLKPANAQDIDRNNVIRELIETERKYVQDLEVMHNYARVLMTQDVVDQDTIHHLFPGLNKLLDFQRKFSIELEQQNELPWEQQRWGRCFSTNEANFAVYEPYCANYTHASELVLAEEPHLMQLAHIINPKSELPAFLIKPVQRICKYPLLLESLVKRCTPDHEFYQELVEGAASSKRIADKVNEAQRRAENVATVKLLERRVEDWKGHALSNFGDLLLDDVFMVTKSDVDREYHVFLFEKIILCCKDATAPPTNKKVGKSNSILKKTPSAQPTPSLLSGGAAAAKKKTTPLLLKGRIFLNNVTQATPQHQMGAYSLQVWWRGDDDDEYFTLRCRNEEQMKQWENVITRLIKEAHIKHQEKAEKLRHHSHSQSINYHERMGSFGSAASSTTTLPPYPGPPNGAVQRRTYGSYPDEKANQGPYSAGGYYGQPQAPRYQSNEWAGGWDNDDDYDENTRYNEYGVPESGRGTPSGRRGAAGISMPPERDLAPGYDRPRAKTEDAATFAQWKKQQQQYPSEAVPGLPHPSQGRDPYSRPPLSSRQTSESSFGNGGNDGTWVPQPGLRHQMSSGKLRSPYEESSPTNIDRATAYSRYASNGGGYGDGQYQGNRQSTANSTHGLPRTRAVSNPSAYAQQSPSQQVPPVPIAPQWTGSSQSSGGGRIGGGSSRERLTSTGGRNQSSMGMRRPVSGGSSDTGESEEQPESGPANGTLRGSRSQIFNPSSNHNAHMHNGGYMSSHAGGNYGHHTGSGPAKMRPGVGTDGDPPIRIKVYWGEDLFVIQVPRSVSYGELVARVQKKIRLCGGGNTEGPLRLRYDDEDGDKISLSSDEELQMAFDMTASRSTGQGQLTLRVN